MAEIIAAPLNKWRSTEMVARRKSRYAADRRLKLYGMAAVAAALGFLAFLFASLIWTGHSAFTQSYATVQLDLTGAKIDPAAIDKADWRGILRKQLRALDPDLTRPDEKKFFEIFSSSAHFIVRDAVVADPSLIGKVSTYALPLSDPFDQLRKGAINRSLPEDQRRVTDAQLKMYDKLDAQGLLSRQFNTGLFTNADSRFPELAGVWGSVVGSFWVVLICFLISFPMGIGAAIYLEEFAKKGRLTDIIEININNLAAVPSVVFGLLGLSVFLGWFGMPRSAPIVGGMVLALMTLPTIIIVTRAALKSVPSSIREAALGIGASKHEMIFHHVLPLAMPSILTGTIIGLAHALGETAPLLLIGMNAFITSVPESAFSAATTLPTQIYIWSDSPERGFVSRTSAAILVLLGLLVVMNAFAVYLRSRLERRW
jgi:phosphate transport system permease protein